MSRRNTYEVVVRGPVPQELLAELGATSLTEEPAHTVLLTEAIDQAALHGMLEHLRSLGLELLEIRSRTTTASVQDGHPPE